MQYRIEYGSETARARVFIGRGGIVRLVRVVGTADQMASPEAEAILLSFRLPGDNAAAKSPKNAPSGGPPVLPPKNVPANQGNEPTIIAGGFAPPFKDVAPEGGLLIGMEFGIGKFGRDDVIKTGRPIYRVSGKEQFGPQRGTKPDAPVTVVTLKAKEGYAVGRVTCKFGLSFDGCSLTSEGEERKADRRLV